jgi:hypothetical protein
VLLKELTIPALPEVHVGTLSACTTAAITQPFAAPWKRRAALAADLASVKDGRMTRARFLRTAAKHVQVTKDLIINAIVAKG